MKEILTRLPSHVQLPLLHLALRQWITVSGSMTDSRIFLISQSLLLLKVRTLSLYPQTSLDLGKDPEMVLSLIRILT